MAVTYTREQEKIKDEVEERNSPQHKTIYCEGDVSQASVQFLDLDIQPDIGERMYTVVIRDPLNLEKPVAATIHVFSDGTVQAEETDGDVEDLLHEYGIKA